MQIVSEPSLNDSDPAIAAIIAAECRRQQRQIELIASENIVSKAVLEAQGSVLTNKYAEGYPGRRYYGGCEHVDASESLAIERAKELFGCAFANVQPHSGAQANAAVLFALLKPGEKLLGMSLAAGGHLTHGAAPTLSGKWMTALAYGVHQGSMLIDYEEVERLALEHRPQRVTGKVAEQLLERAGMTCNKNAIPFDPEKPSITSGVRLGTPAATTRGLLVPDFIQVGNWIADVLDCAGEQVRLAHVIGEVRGLVEQLCARHPIY
jgi:glycine/serine hydroxymethyltransferase